MSTAEPLAEPICGELAEGERTPSEIVGYLVLVAVMLFAAIEASRLLGFVLLADLVAQFTAFCDLLHSQVGPPPRPLPPAS